MGVLLYGLLIYLDFNSRLKLNDEMIIMNRDFIDECPNILLIIFGKRRSECDISEDCHCPRCGAPLPYLYKNNGTKGQIQCKVCQTLFNPENKYNQP